MARYGYRAEAAAIFKGLFEASTYIDLKRLPELFCGFPRLRSHGPTFYPVACSPQAWAAAATLSLLRSCLGLSFDPENGYVIFDQPVLPDFVEDVTLRQLGLGNGGIDVGCRGRTRRWRFAFCRAMAASGQSRAASSGGYSLPLSVGWRRTKRHANQFPGRDGRLPVSGRQQVWRCGEQRADCR